MSESVKSLGHVRLFLPHGLQPSRLLCPWNSPSKNTGVSSHSLLEGIFPTQGSNLGFLHCRQSLYLLSRQGSPINTTLPLQLSHLFFLRKRFKKKKTKQKQKQNFCGCLVWTNGSQSLAGMESCIQNGPKGEVSQRCTRHGSWP